MKKFLIGFVFLIGLSLSSQKANSQVFGTVDSLKTYINIHIRNSAINAFTNLRLNTTLNAIANFLDSARLAWGGGGGGAADGNNYSSTLSLSSGVLTMGRNGLSSLTTNVTSTHVTEGSNLYFTNARARSALSAGLGIGYNSTTGEITADTATIFTYIPYFSWDNKSGFDSTTWLKSSTEVRNKSLIQNMAGIGMVDSRTITDSTIAHVLSPKVVGVKNFTEMRALTSLVASDTQFVFRVTEYYTGRIYDYQYDPNNSTATDDGKDTIVAGTKRFFRRFDVWNVLDYGADPTGTVSSTAAFRYLLSKLGGSKNIKNRKIYVPRGDYLVDTLATPNSAGWFTIEGEGPGQTRLIWTCTTTGKDFITFLNAQQSTIKNLALVGRRTSEGQPRNMINYRTASPIVGTAGMIADNLVENVVILGNEGSYDNGLVFTAAADFDQNNEQATIRNCRFELAEKYALWVSHYNSLWHRAYSCRFSGNWAAVNISKPNPGGSVDSSGGSIALFGCTLMGTGGNTDTLLKVIGGQVIVMDGRNENAVQRLIYARKSADGSPPQVDFVLGQFTMGAVNGAAGVYHIDVSGGNTTFNNTQLAPDNLLKIRAADSTTSFKIIGCVNVDTLWLSANVRFENPCFDGSALAVTSTTRSPVRQWLSPGYGTFQRGGTISNSRELSAPTSTVEGDGDDLISLRPSTATDLATISNKAPYTTVAIRSNGNVTLKNTGNLNLPYSSIALPEDNILHFTRDDIAHGGEFIISGGLGMVRNGMHDGKGVGVLGGSLIENTLITNDGFDFRVSDRLKIGLSTNSPAGTPMLQLYKTGFAELHMVNTETNDNFARVQFIKQEGGSYTLTTGRQVGPIAWNEGILSFGAVANASVNGGFSGLDYRWSTTTNAGASRTNAMYLNGNGQLLLNTASALGTELFRNTGTSSFGGVAKYEANYGSSYDSRTLVDKNYVDSSVDADANFTQTFTSSDATPTTIVTITPLTGETVTVVAILNGIKSNGDASVSGTKSRSFLRSSGGTLTATSETTDRTVAYLGSGLSTATFTITTSGTNIIIQFTGEAATDISGKVTYKVTRVAAPL